MFAVFGRCVPVHLCFVVYDFCFVYLFFEKSETQETSLIPTKLPQNLTPGRFRRAESESQVKNLEILHPDLQIKANHPEV